jgi:hypothetical protein
MILVSCAAIWPLESLRNQNKSGIHTNIAPSRDLGAHDPHGKEKGPRVIVFVYKDREQICVKVEGKEAK